MRLVSLEAITQWHDEHKEETELAESAIRVELDVHYGENAPALGDIDEVLDTLTPREAFKLGQLAAAKTLLNSHAAMVSAQHPYRVNL